MDRVKIFLLLLAIAAVSCTREAYTPGTADPAGCYRVYFPRQAGYGFIALRPSADREITYRAARERTDGAITVPVEITTSASGIFEVDPIRFEDGEAETTFSVRFPGVEEQVQYGFELKVTDPQYASNYMMERRYIAFDVLVGNRKIVPNRRTDWTFQYYSGYYYVRAAEGNYGFITVPASAGDPEDPAYVQQVLEAWNSDLEDHYSGIAPTFLTDYSTAAWSLFTGTSHYGATPRSSGYSGNEKDLIGFMVGVTDTPYATGDYQFIRFTVE